MTKFITISATIILLLLNSSAFSQEQKLKNIQITSIPTQFIFLDFPVLVELHFKRSTIGVLFSYRPDVQKSGEARGPYGLLSNYEYQNIWNFLYRGWTVGANSKYYVVEEPNLFLDACLLYRNWSFENKYAHAHNPINYNYRGTRTEQVHVYALKILFGKSFQKKRDKKIFPVIDLYGGIGVRYKTFEYQTYNGTVNEEYYAYKLDKGQMWLPSIHGGLKLGIGISK